MAIKFIYSDAEEKYARSAVLYSHSDNVLYEDAAHTIPVNRETLMNLCLKCMVLVYHTDASYYTVAAFKDNTTDVSVSIETSSEIVTLKSKEAGGD